MLVNPESGVFATGVLGFEVAGPVMFVLLFSVMWLPGAVGIVISEPSRSALDLPCAQRRDSGLGRWQTVAASISRRPVNQSHVHVRRRPCGGFAYWAPIAGWNAGFWKTSIQAGGGRPHNIIRPRKQTA
jgi:hypothetical protein